MSRLYICSIIFLYRCVLQNSDLIWLSCYIDFDRRALDNCYLPIIRSNNTCNLYIIYLLLRQHFLSKQNHNNVFHIFTASDLWRTAIGQNIIRQVLPTRNFAISYFLVFVTISKKHRSVFFFFYRFYNFNTSWTVLI